MQKRITIIAISLAVIILLSFSVYAFSFNDIFNFGNGNVVKDSKKDIAALTKALNSLTEQVKKLNEKVEEINNKIQQINEQITELNGSCTTDETTPNPSSNDELIISQAIAELNKINNNVIELMQATGNKRTIDFQLSGGELLIDGNNGKIVWILKDTKYKYSEPDYETSIGSNLKAITKKNWGKYNVQLTLDYSKNIKFTLNKQPGSKVLKPTTLPYKLILMNSGLDQNPGFITIDISFNPTESVPNPSDNPTQEGQACANAARLSIETQQGYTCYNTTTYGTTLLVQIGRGADGSTPMGMQIAVSGGGKSKVFTAIDKIIATDNITMISDAVLRAATLTGLFIPGVAIDIPKANEARTYVISTGISMISGVTVAPIVNEGGTEKICSVTSTATLNLCRTA
jgi:cell division protein FtsB